MKIFLSYGKNIKLKNEIYDFLIEENHCVIDLVEECNKGKTIIEKLETCSDVDKVIVLLTSDDTVKPYKGKKTIKCARQNVIFELGYFVAKLKRENVIIVIDNKEVLKLLTDYQASYILNDSNMIKKLTKELRG